MKRLLFPSLLGAVALLAPGRSLAQDKPVLNTAPIVVPAPAPVTPAPVPVPVAPTTPVETPVTPTPAPAPGLPTPDTYSPSGFELPEREQKRKALEQHAEQYTKLFLYSGFGLSYGSNYYSDGGQFNASISPAIGYRVSDRFSIGPGISYAYTNYSFGRNIPSISTSNFGIKGFAQFMVYNQFFAHAEYEVTKAQLPEVDSRNYLTGRTVSYTVKAPLLGAGYRSQVSNRIAADIVLLYNFNDGYESIYNNPVIRFNLLFNLGR